MKKIKLLICVFCLFQVKAMAQSPKRSEIPVSIEIYNHTIGLPFGNPFKKPFNLGIALSSAYPLMLKDHSKLTIDGKLGYFRHKELATGIQINTGVTYSYTTDFGLYAAVGIPVGYVRTYNAYNLYALNDAGDYEQKKDGGRSSLFTGYSLQLGYDFRRSTGAPIALFIKNEWLIQTNYSKFMPSLMQNSLRAGISVYPFKN